MPSDDDADSDGDAASWGAGNGDAASWGAGDGDAGS